MTADMVIRRAVAGEHDVLNELSLRSVQEAWGYSDEFMAWEPEAITVTPIHVEEDLTFVLESDGKLLGFYVLRSLVDEVQMLRLMVSPEALGKGCGRLLWDHAVLTARSLAPAAMTLDADPNAEPFYKRMGAETVGEHDWEPPMMPGWRVKKMRFDLRPRPG